VYLFYSNVYTPESAHNKALRPMVHKNNVTKHNTLITASYRLSLNEQRLILLAISKINPQEPVTEGKLFFVTVKEFQSAMGVDYQSAYKALLEAEDSLFDRRISLEGSTGDGGDSGKSRWIQSVRYYRREGKVGLRFSYDVLPYLTELKSHFTSYALAEVANLTSVYAVRLFEMLSQYKSTRWFTISLEDFKQRLCLEGYNDIRNLKARVITVAVEQIKAHTEFKNLRYQQETQGRKVVGFVFFF
jgi:plasmid replication initiation protein